MDLSFKYGNWEDNKNGLNSQKTDKEQNKTEYGPEDFFRSRHKEISAAGAHFASGDQYFPGCGVSPFLFPILHNIHLSAAEENSAKGPVRGRSDTADPQIIRISSDKHDLIQYFKALRIDPVKGCPVGCHQY